MWRRKYLAFGVCSTIKSNSARGGDGRSGRSIWPFAQHGEVVPRAPRSASKSHAPQCGHGCNVPISTTYPRTLTSCMASRRTKAHPSNVFGAPLPLLPLAGRTAIEFARCAHVVRLWPRWPQMLHVYRLRRGLSRWSPISGSSRPGQLRWLWPSSPQMLHVYGPRRRGLSRWSPTSGSSRSGQLRWLWPSSPQMLHVHGPRRRGLSRWSPISGSSRSGQRR